MRKGTIFAGALLALSLSPAAWAEDFPARKPGLWEITMNLGANPPRVVRYCIDAATDARMREMGQNTVDGMCGRHEIHRAGNTVTSDSVCKIGPSEVSSHTVTTFVDDTAYSTVIASHYDPPMMGNLADSKATQEARWIGPCGPDMKPGDMIVQGRKMHMPTAPR